MPYKNPMTNEQKAKKAAGHRAWVAANPEYNRQYYAKNKAVMLARAKAWAKANPEKIAVTRAKQLPLQKGRIRSWHLKKKYGVTRAEYDRMWEAQGRGCAICKATENNPKDHEFPLDHDHKTGAVRGILCGPCNRLLGQAKDSALVLHQAAFYLGSH